MKDQLKTIREALNLALTWPDTKYEHPFIKQALTALDQLEAMVGEQEPVCWAESDGEGGILWDQDSCFSDDPAWFDSPMPLYAAPPAQQYEAGDVASAAAQGFRDGMASVAQQPQAEAVHRYVLELPDGDKREVKIYWIERQETAGEITHRLCVAVDAAPQQAEEVPSDVVRERELRCVIADLTDECKSLRALLEKLIDVEGPQPGTAQWADEVRAAIAQQKGQP